MPKMVYVKGVGHVRAGSWSTKPVIEQWRQTSKQLEDAELICMRLEYLLFQEGSEYSKLYREAYEDSLIRRLEYLRKQIDALLGKFSKESKAAALENVAGRTPEEAAIYLAKARAIRKSMRT